MARKTKEESQKPATAYSMPPSGFSWKRAWALLPWPTWRTPPGFLAVRSTATTRTRSRSAWRCATAPSARSRYPTKTPGCRRWISSCAPAWAFSASAASPVRCSGCWRSSTSSANAATRTSRCCAAASCSRSRATLRPPADPPGGGARRTAGAAGRRAGQHLSAIALGRHLRHPGLDRAPARRSLEPRRTHVPRRPRQPAQFSYLLLADA